MMGSPKRFPQKKGGRVDYKLTPEAKKALIGLMPFTQEKTISVIPDAYNQKGIPNEFKPKFDQRSYTRSEYNEITAKLTEGARTSDPFFLEWGRKSIKGWSGIIDLATEKPIDFEGDENGNPKKEKWDLIPPVIQADLFANAMKLSGLVSVETRSLSS